MTAVSVGFKGWYQEGVARERSQVMRRSVKREEPTRMIHPRRERG
jgi:hypothetical protein